jgi:hypothetical protein
MSRTITTNYPGLTITSSGDSPLTIDAGVTLAGASVSGGSDAGPAGIGLTSTLANYFIITNDGTIAGGTLNQPDYIGGSPGIGLTTAALTNASNAYISGYRFGVSISQAGSVNNSGTIALTRSFGDYAKYADPFDAAMVLGSGTVANNADARIFGGIGIGNTVAGRLYLYAGANDGGPGTVLKNGLISSAPAGYAAGFIGGFGVALMDGGTVSNGSTGLIDGDVSGVEIYGTGTITNAAGGTITAQVAGAVAMGSGAVTNMGDILTARYGAIGVSIVAAGTVTNGEGATIVGDDGVSVDAGPNPGGIVTNSGYIGGVLGDGVDTTGSVTNTKSGTIVGYIFGVVTAQTVSNQGDIEGALNDGIFMSSPGVLTNLAGGRIFGKYVAVQAPTANIYNQGYMNGDAGSGISVTSSGTVTNATGGTIFGLTDDGILVDGYLLLANNAGATIVGTTYGVNAQTGTIVNAGTITTRIGPTGTMVGVGLTDGGSLTNTNSGQITGQEFGVQLGLSKTSASGTLINQGVVFASNLNPLAPPNTAQGTAIRVLGPAEVYNSATGTIEEGPRNGYSNGFNGIVTYAQATIINKGLIGGTNFAVSAATTGFGNLVELAPGASFANTVMGADSAADAGLATLELLSGGSVGTVTGFGSRYINFGAINLDTGAAWSVQGTIGGSTTVGFAKGGTGSLSIGAPRLATGTFTGFGLGETISLAGIDDVTHISLASGNILDIAESAGPGLTLNFDPTQSFAGETFQYALSGGATNITVSCFAAGTLIRTIGGPVMVEELTTNMRAVTYHGEARQIVWVGHRKINCVRHPDPMSVQPVRISAGAFRPGLPSRDLLLSPDHAVYVDNVLIPIKHLINSSTIEQVPVDKVTYYHVELDQHDVLFAEGLPAESFLDTGNRSNFANGGTAIALHPDFSVRMWEAMGCAPLIVTGPVLTSVRTKLLHRAAALAIETAQGRSAIQISRAA